METMTIVLLQAAGIALFALAWYVRWTAAAKKEQKKDKLAKDKLVNA